MKLGIENIRKEDFDKIQRAVIQAIYNAGFSIEDSIYIEDGITGEHLGFGMELGELDND